MTTAKQEVVTWLRNVAGHVETEEGGDSGMAVVGIVLSGSGETVRGGISRINDNTIELIDIKGSFLVHQIIPFNEIATVSALSPNPDFDPSATEDQSEQDPDEPTIEERGFG